MRHRRPGRRGVLVDMAHVAGLVAAGVYPSPLPHAHVVTSTTHKTLRGRAAASSWRGQDEDFCRKLDSAVFPGIQGGPLMHVIAAKAVAFKEALAPAFKDYQRQVVANARAMAAVIQRRGYRIVSGGTDNHLMLIDLSDRPTPARTRTRPERGPHHGEQELGAERSALALRHLGPAHRHAGADHARLRTDRLRDAGGLAVRCAGRVGGGHAGSVSARVAEQVTALCRRHSVYRRPS